MDSGALWISFIGWQYRRLSYGFASTNTCLIDVSFMGKESFDLSLARYGITGVRASGNITHFVDSSGVPQMSILVMQKYESPVLACDISEVLSSLAGEDKSNMPSLILPFVLDSSKIKLEKKNSPDEPLIRVLKTPAFILIGQIGQHKTTRDDLEVVCKIGETLASVSSLQFVKENVTWNPNKGAKEHEKEPWRALYG
ncbi:hypothetical protein LXL04_020673 [Taraxacum kok-saghyz]